jgi:hypothetical protein
VAVVQRSDALPGVTIPSDASFLSVKNPFLRHSVPRAMLRAGVMSLLPVLERCACAVRRRLLVCAEPYRKHGTRWQRRAAQRLPVPVHRDRRAWAWQVRCPVQRPCVRPSLRLLPPTNWRTPTHPLSRSVRPCVLRACPVQSYLSPSLVVLLHCGVLCDRHTATPPHPPCARLPVAASAR